jgi:LacI family transcriptional regulator
MMQSRLPVKSQNLKGPSRPTMSHIARQAGVSRPTVSLILNRRDRQFRISSLTRRCVLEVARKLNYRPDPAAIALKGAATQTIGLLWSLAGHQPDAILARDISLAAQRRGYMIHLANYLGNSKMALGQLAAFRRHRLDAVVVQDNAGLLNMAPIRKCLREFAAVLVIAGRVWEKAPVDLIHHDRLTAIRQAADHFASIGRRRPAILTAFPSPEKKAEAFLRQCRLRGMQVTQDSILAVDADPTRSLADVCLETLEHRLPAGGSIPFDALLCASDEGAVIAIDHLRRMGLSVPDDVAVIGFNDSLIAPYLDPPLTSIARCDEAVAAVAEEMLFHRLADPSCPVQHRRMPMQLIRRKSA